MYTGKTTKIKNFCQLGISLRKSKKSQMEIMGLMVIIILVALAMLFVIQFVVVREATDIKKTYTHSELATNTNTALLKTTTQCKGQDINQLLQDCAGGESINCNGKGSCAYVAEAIEGILDQTLKEWGKAYRFTVKSGNQDVISPITSGNCEKVDIEPGINPLPGGIIVRLDICG
jgi:hypothetical protein